jgi:hypothetical protein
MLHSIKRRNANWNGHILSRKLLLKHVTESKIQGTGRRGEDVSSYWMTLRIREDTELPIAFWRTCFV